MSKRTWTEAEARALVGKRIKTLTAWSGVEEGTTGRVVRADRAGAGWDVGIQWDLPTDLPAVAMGNIDGEPVVVIRTGNPLTDWFSRDEYERYLIEIPD